MAEQSTVKLDHARRRVVARVARASAEFDDQFGSMQLAIDLLQEYGIRLPEHAGQAVADAEIGAIMKALQGAGSAAASLKRHEQSASVGRSLYERGYRYVDLSPSSQVLDAVRRHLEATIDDIAPKPNGAPATRRAVALLDFANAFPRKYNPDIVLRRFLEQHTDQYMGALQDSTHEFPEIYLNVIAMLDEVRTVVGQRVYAQVAQSIKG